MNNEAAITTSAYDKLIRHCKAALPLEACGLLTCSNDIGVADMVIPISNVHNQPRQSFAFDPQQWTEAYFRMIKNRQTLVGIYHSHPTELTEPSPSDYDGYLPMKDVAYWIIAFPPHSEPVATPYRSYGGSLIPTSLMLA